MCTRGACLNHSSLSNFHALSSIMWDPLYMGAALSLSSFSVVLAAFARLVISCLYICIYEKSDYNCCPIRTIAKNGNGKRERNKTGSMLSNVMKSPLCGDYFLSSSAPS